MRRRSSPAPPETSTLYLLKQLELAVRSHLDDLVRPLGLTALQYTALTVLERHPDLTAAQLARGAFVTAQSMADMVTALTDRELIQRRRNPADRRQLLLSLTTAGRTLLRQNRRDVDRLEDQMLAGMSPAAVRRFRRSITTARSNLAGEPRK